MSAPPCRPRCTRHFEARSRGAPPDGPLFHLPPPGLQRLGVAVHSDRRRLRRASRLAAQTPGLASVERSPNHLAHELAVAGLKLGAVWTDNGSHSALQELLAALATKGAR